MQYINNILVRFHDHLHHGTAFPTSELEAVVMRRMK